ncbi:MAG TPA: four helix bundle protein [Lacunisphaera sp.]|jgi:four helix bundle protein|nr:four helix bundle protein [Lacunisphaera sp.]
MPDSSNRFRFQRLEVWQEGRKLYRMVSRMVRQFPKEESYGLTSQMRRSARSVCANIAEGSGRNSDRDFAQFIEITYGSAMEVASDVFLALDEGYITAQDHDQLLAQVEVVAAKASGLYRKLTGTPPSAVRTPRTSEA